MQAQKRPIAERLLPLTIAALGLAAAWGTQHYLSSYLTFAPALLAAGAIELAYICLALMRAGIELQREIKSTTLALVWASVAFNFGHAYQVAVPGGLMPGTARFELLALVQAIAIAGFVPWIAYRLSSVQGSIAVAEQESAEQSAEVQRLQQEVQVLKQAAAEATAAAATPIRPIRRGAIPAARPVTPAVIPAGAEQLP